jgi:hypothetical protein
MAHGKTYAVTTTGKQRSSSAADDKENGKFPNGHTERSVSLEPVEPLRRSFVQRHAFLITMLCSVMIDGLEFQVSSQFKYRFFHDMFSGELALYNASRRSVCGEGKTLLPEVQVGSDFGVL